MRVLQSAGVVAAIVALSGCASTATWQHPARAGDGHDGATMAWAECQRYAAGTGPAPRMTARMDVPGPTSYTTRGTYSQYGSTGTFNAITTANQGAGSSFASGYNAGASLGDAFAEIARQRQQKSVATACMRTLGWIDTSTPEGQAQFKQAATEFSEKPSSNQAAEDKAVKEKWITTINTFLETEAARPGGIDYRSDKKKHAALDKYVKQLANDPKNERQSMVWFLVEAHKMVLLENETISKPANPFDKFDKE